MFRPLLVKLLALPVVGIACLLAAPTAAPDARSGPVAVALTSDVAGCPSAYYVATNPGSEPSPVFVLVPPGPPNCPGGLDVMISPGQSPAGEAVSLPPTDSSCQAATQLLSDELSALGQTSSGPPSSGPSDTKPPCFAGPGGLLLELLLLQIIGIQVDFGNPSFVSLTVSANDTAAQSNLLAIIQGRVEGSIDIPSINGHWRYDALGTPIGDFNLHDPGPGGTPGHYEMVPSAVAGLATVCQPPGC